MKLLFVSLFFISLLNIQAQTIQEADLSIPFYITFNNPPYPVFGEDTLFVGIDSIATDSIDTILGEANLPPIPPPGFAYRLVLPYNNFNGVLSSFRDYRNGIVPITGTINYKLSFWSGATIHWQLPDGVTGLLQDFFGGVIVNHPISGIDSFYVPSPFSELKLFLYFGNYYPGADPIFSANPDTINFPPIPMGETATLSSSITNQGENNTLIIYNINTSNLNYSVSQNSYPIFITAQTSKQLNVTYTAVAGEQSGFLEIIHNGESSPDTIFLHSAAQILPDVLCSLTISSGTLSKVLEFGLSETASDSCDPELGENCGITPFPPSGIFEATFFLPQGGFDGSVRSIKDFRFGTIPYIEQKEFRFAFQEASGHNIMIHCDLVPGVNGIIKDLFTGTIINVTISDTGSYYPPVPFYSAQLKMLIDFSNIIPVELNSFTAIPQNNSVNLNWLTATKTNNQGFAIERKQVFSQQSSAGNEEWNTIGFVSGNGTTTEPQSYSFVDENLSSGIYYYRLKQIDYDGTSNYSNEIEVEITPSEFALEQNFPNPFNPSTSIQYAIGNKQFVQLKVYDVLGNEIATLVNEEKSAGSYEVEFDVAQDSRPAIASGIYFYKLQAGEFVETKKMLLLK